MRTTEREALRSGITLFNKGRYFEAHEEWEEEWRLMPEGDERELFRGLIMAAGAFVHYLRRECAGSRTLLEQSVGVLKNAGRGTDKALRQFVEELERVYPSIAGCSFTLAPEALPRIALGMAPDRTAAGEGRYEG